jgi:uncharacterized glyoxalase superfamily protein PhnB
MIRAVNPYLNFPGNTEEAFEFYRSVFGGEFAGLVRFRDFPDNPMGVPEEDLDRIAHMALPLGEGNLLMGTDVICRGRTTFRWGTTATFTWRWEAPTKRRGSSAGSPTAAAPPCPFSAPSGPSSTATWSTASACSGW